MTKIKLLVVAAIAIAAVETGVYTSVVRSNDAVASDVVLANVEALATGESATGDTGPAEIVDCAGWFSGTKKECMCRNSNPCTPTPCK